LSPSFLHKLQFGAAQLLLLLPLLPLLLLLNE